VAGLSDGGSALGDLPMHALRHLAVLAQRVERP